MEELRQVVKRYLEKNGISTSFFANYIGCKPYTVCKWFSGICNLNTRQLKKTHEFLSGKHWKSVEEILSKEG